MKLVIHVEVWNCSAMTTLQWNPERNILRLSDPLILFLHVCNTGVSQLNSAEMTFSSFWFSSWGSHTASLSIHSYVIFTVMEEYNSTCYSFSRLSQKTLRLALVTEWSHSITQRRRSGREGLVFAEVMILVFSIFSGPAETLLCQERSRWNHICENLIRKACCWGGGYSR